MDDDDDDYDYDDYDDDDDDDDDDNSNDDGVGDSGHNNVEEEKKLSKYDNLCDAIKALHIYSITSTRNDPDCIYCSLPHRSNRSSLPRL